MYFIIIQRNRQECQERDSNPHAKYLARDFKSLVSAISPSWLHHGYYSKKRAACYRGFCFHIGCLAGTRTPTTRIRILGATITPRGIPSFSDWRGRRGSNPQPPDRQSSALTNCATTPLLRKVIHSISFFCPARQWGILKNFQSPVFIRGDAEKKPGAPRDTSPPTRRTRPRDDG